mmetsp:Transcript_56856/g.124360  ORF Transcript_56856/g.124360 Transcript_56856/m.124360 type:complete len:258 (+) Transcript_56856:331-1104(+)
MHLQCEVRVADGVGEGLGVQRRCCALRNQGSEGVFQTAVGLLPMRTQPFEVCDDVLDGEGAEQLEVLTREHHRPIAVDEVRTYFEFLPILVALLLHQVHPDRGVQLALTIGIQDLPTGLIAPEPLLEELADRGYKSQLVSRAQDCEVKEILDRQPSSFREVDRCEKLQNWTRMFCRRVGMLQQLQSPIEIVVGDAAAAFGVHFSDQQAHRAFGKWGAFGGPQLLKRLRSLAEPNAKCVHFLEAGGTRGFRQNSKIIF